MTVVGRQLISMDHESLTYQPTQVAERKARLTQCMNLDGEIPGIAIHFARVMLGFVQHLDTFPDLGCNLLANVLILGDICWPYHATLRVEHLPSEGESESTGKQ